MAQVRLDKLGYSSSYLSIYRSKDGVQTTEIELATKVLDCNGKVTILNT